MNLEPFTNWSEDNASIFEVLEDHHGEDFALMLPVPGGIQINIYKFLKECYYAIEGGEQDHAKTYVDSLMTFFYTSATGQIADLYNESMDWIISKETKNIDEELEEMINNERQGDS
jgi:hypothetical protein